jgi:hypothetical protein
MQKVEKDVEDMDPTERRFILDELGARPEPCCSRSIFAEVLTWVIRSFVRLPSKIDVAIGGYHQNLVSKHLQIILKASIIMRFLFVLGYFLEEYHGSS